MLLLEAAKRHVEQEATAGVTCPCCGQYVRRYRRTITSGMARALIMMRNASRDNRGQWLNVLPVLDESPDAVRLRADYTKLRFWGLIDNKEARRKDGSKRVGVWKVTPLGYAFAEGLAWIPKYRTIQNNELIDEDDTGGQVNIAEALGAEFNYAEIMRTGDPSFRPSLFPNK